MDKLREECGVFGVFGHPYASQVTYFGLMSLQHRGQESAGIVVSDKNDFTYHKGMGLVSEVFGNESLAKLTGENAIGHVRYSGTSEAKIADAQPLVFKYREGPLALAHNGSLVNASQIRRYLEKQGSIFQTTSDTEVIAHLIARSAYDDIVDAIKEALSMVKGAYALLIMTLDKVIGVLDPNAIRPLALGKLGDGYVFSSETCAFDVIGAEYIREIEPGELVIIDENGVRSERFSHNGRYSICSFEYIYFARPDSNIHGANVHQIRRRLGVQLAKEFPVEADVVTGVPDSSMSAAIGYAETTGIPYELGLIKNRYVGRTFIQPTEELRTRGVQIKLNAIRKVVEGKRVVMIDDSMVRGTTSSRIVRILRQAGATEVHVRISSPPIRHSCFYGIDTSSPGELIVTRKTMDEICEYIGADSLHFLSEEGLIEAIDAEINENIGENGLCLACFNGKYPTDIFPDN
ncbi:MAG: amidophosphoribosyltransferase [Firmicutes bacterium]|nr:amidophosphoribosyltransferase [Bacillota bacterium]